MVADAEMFDFRVPALVFSELAGGIVIAIQRGSFKDGHVKAIEELSEEEDFVGCTVDSDVLSVTGGISCVLLFAGCPRYHA